MYLKYLGVLLLLPALSQAQMYRWVDDNGKVHYSDQAPATNAKSVQKQAAASGQSASPQLPYALQMAVKNFPVTLYTADGCKACGPARELLNKRGIPYKDVAVVTQQDVAKLKSVAGVEEVPVMTVGREVLTSFDSSAYQISLDAAGYPSTSQLPPGAQGRQIVKPAEKAAPAAAANPGDPAAQPAPK